MKVIVTRIKMYNFAHLEGGTFLTKRWCLLEHFLSSLWSFLQVLSFWFYRHVINPIMSEYFMLAICTSLPLTDKKHLRKVLT